MEVFRLMEKVIGGSLWKEKLVYFKFKWNTLFLNEQW